MNFTESQTDALQEVLNTGVGRAAAMLHDKDSKPYSSYQSFNFYMEVK